MSAISHKSLLLVAHGSRREASNQEVRALASRIRKQAADRFGCIECAFLELAEPSIPEGIDTCVQAGAREVLVLPYFLSAGRHVAEDIPQLVLQKQQQYPSVTITLLPHLGAADGIATLLLDMGVLGGIYTENQ